MVTYSVAKLKDKNRSAASYASGLVAKRVF
jgi:hypothetical protein